MNAISARGYFYIAILTHIHIIIKYFLLSMLELLRSLDVLLMSEKLFSLHYVHGTAI